MNITYNIPSGDKCNGCYLYYMGFNEYIFLECILHKQEVFRDEEGNIYKCELCRNCNYCDFDVEKYYESFNTD